MPNIVRFDCYDVDLPAGQLYKHGLRISLRDKSFQVLAALLEHPGQVVTREELRQRLWREEVFVDFDNNLNTAITRLREALCDSADHPHFIETLPKRGYRFLAECFRTASNTAEDPAKQSQTNSASVRQPKRRSGGGVLQRRHDGRDHHRARAIGARTAGRDCPHHDHALQGQSEGCGPDRPRVGRGLRRGRRRSPVRGHVDINVQLIQVSDQTHLFARKYDAALDDIFNTARHVALDIADRIGVAPLPGNIGAGLAVGGRTRQEAYRESRCLQRIHSSPLPHGQATAESLAEIKSAPGEGDCVRPRVRARLRCAGRRLLVLGLLGFYAPAGSICRRDRSRAACD